MFVVDGELLTLKKGFNVICSYLILCVRNVEKMGTDDGH